MRKKTEEKQTNKQTVKTYPRTVGHYRKCNLCIARIPEGEEREKGTKELFDVIMTENFPKLMSDFKPQIQEIQRMPRKICTPKTSSRHIAFKLQKIKHADNLERS